MADQGASHFGRDIDPAKPSPEMARRVAKDIDEDAGDHDPQLGNETPGGAHWPKGLVLHPGEE